MNSTSDKYKRKFIRIELMVKYSGFSHKESETKKPI